MSEQPQPRRPGRPPGIKNKTTPPQNAVGHAKYGGKKEYYPPLEEWEQGCACSGSKRALARFLGMSPDWLHSFLEKESVKEDSDYFKIYKKKKQDIQKEIMDAYHKSLETWDLENGITPSPSLIIFGMKSTAGFDENSEITRLKKLDQELRQREMKLKEEQFAFEKEKFLAQMEKEAVKLTLSVDEETLQKFAKKISEDRK